MLQQSNLKKISPTKQAANVQEPCSWYCMHGDGSLAVGGIHKPHMHARAVHQKTDIKQGVGGDTNKAHVRKDEDEWHAINNAELPAATSQRPLTTVSRVASGDSEIFRPGTDPSGSGFYLQNTVANCSWKPKLSSPSYSPGTSR
jgi:hypothetical protein